MADTNAQALLDQQNVSISLRIIRLCLCLIKLNDKDYFDTVFDILNDDDDYDHGNKEGRAVGAHQQQQQSEMILEEYFEDFDFDYIETNVDEEEMFMVIDDEDSMTNDSDGDDDADAIKVMNNKQSSSIHLVFREWKNRFSHRN